MNDPWAFGWTQLLTITGLVLTAVVSFSGLRTFKRWKREKIEEKRLDVALEALSIAYEAQMVFQDVRRRFIHEYEWAGMPTEGLSQQQIEQRRSLWAIINRFDRHVSFFEKLLVLQPKFMAIFGRETQDIFSKLHQARNTIQAACEVLIFVPNPTTKDEQETNAQMRSDIWDHQHPLAKEPGRVTKLIDGFRDEIEKRCFPLVDHELGGQMKEWQLEG